MASVLVISSYVAASRVGGGIAPYVLGPMGIDAVHVPTTMFGRHPGHGAPGGGRIDADVMQGMLDGIEAQGLYQRFDAVLTGYFADPSQVEVAAQAIERVRAGRSGATAPLVVVDPIMGDLDTGLYVREDTAAAVTSQLVPLADLVACNHWEFQRLTGRAPTVGDVIKTARSVGGDWLVGSIPFRDRMANVIISGQRVYAAAGDVVPEPNPKGTGDLFRLVYLGQRLKGVQEAECVHRAIWSVETVLRTGQAHAGDAAERDALGLSLAACSRLLADPQQGGVVIPLEGLD